MPALNFPANPVNGQVYDTYTYDTGVGAWRSASTATAATLVSPTAPISTTSGDLWWNTNDGSFYVNYWDGSSYQWVEGRSPQTSQYNYSANHLINGAFDFWQRGTSFTSTGYTADRWYSPISNATVSQETADLPAGFRYGIKYVTTAASGFAQFNQPIERDIVIGLRGKTVTVSGWIKITGSFLGRWAVQAYYSNSTDAYASLSTAVTGSQKYHADATTTSWTKFSHTFVVPADAVGMRIENIPEVVSNAGVTVRMAGLQLEEGSVVTAFRRNQDNLAAEFATCQRYYEKSYNFDVTPGVASQAGAVYQGVASDQYGNATYTIPYSVPKRAIPSIKLWSTAGTANVWTYHRSGVGNTDSTGNWTGGWPGTHQGMVYFGTGAANVACTVFGNWALDAEL